MTQAEVDKLVQGLADSVAHLLGDALPPKWIADLLEQARREHGWVHPHDRANAATMDTE